MKRVYLLVEGPTDEAFLRRVLPPEVLAGAELVVAGGSEGIPSLARSVLVRRKSPVAVLMDSDSLHPSVIEERQQSTEDLIQAADAAVPVKVITAKPEIEAWFLAAPEIIEQVTGKKVTEDWIETSINAPKQALEMLAAEGGHPWDSFEAINALDDAAVAKIRMVPEVAELSAFLEWAKEGQAA